MIIYNKTLLDNTFLREEAFRLHSSRFITNAQFESIQLALPALKTQQSILLRIGLFLLGSILYASICGAVSYIFSSLFFSTRNFYIPSFLFALIGFAVAEYLIREKKYFGYGLEEAFVMWGQISLITAIYAIISNDFSNHLMYNLFIVASIVSLLTSLRYINILSVFLFYFSVCATVFSVFLHFAQAWLVIFPFMMMMLAVSTYFISKYIYNTEKKPYYSNNLELIGTLSLVLFYLSGNYFIVNKLLYELFPYENGSGMAEATPLAIFYWLVTFIIPVSYVYFSLRNRDRVMLWTGCIGLAFSIFTYRMYYHLVPAELALTIGGFILFAFSFFTMKRMRNKEEGLTSKQDRLSDKNALLDAEALFLASQSGFKSVEDSKPFSGGDGFNGGGAGSSF